MHNSFIFPLFSYNRSTDFLKSAYPRSAWRTLVGTISPQAEDTATEYQLGTLWGMLATGIVYVMYAVYKDLQLDWPTIAEKRAERRRSLHTERRDVSPVQADVEPHAEEMPASPNMVSQNVTFKDAHPGYEQKVESEYDVLRNAPFLSDASLDEFFSRPLRIASYDWAVNGTLFQDFNPWTLYFSNPRVINRISNYKLMRCKLHVKFTINGNAFHYGRAIAAYNPLHNDDTLTVDRAFLDIDVIGASQRPHVYLDPTNSQGGSMCLPFFWYRNVLDIVAEDWQNMGSISLHSLQALKHANGASDTVTVNVFAWAEDVKFAIPTNFEPGSIAPQADEYDKRPVSRIAGAVASAAAYLTEVPVIGPFARATEIGATAMGAMATLFGYSSPVMLETSRYRPEALANMSVVNQMNESVKLSLDAKQELTIDARTVGLDGTDELTISSIVKRESFITNFPWAIGTPQEEILFNLIVDPCLYDTIGSGVDTEYHFPATAFAALPFKYWRGTMKIRFQFVCSKYHKGRVKIVYDPEGTPSGSAEYNTAYTTIVDISDTSDFTIDVGWGQPDVYREHVPVTTVVPFGTSRLGAYKSSLTEYGNGTLSVYVVNELTVPNDTVNNDIEVNVFVSAGDDFEVAVPDALLMENWRFRTASVQAAPASCDVLPQAGEDEQITDESKPTNPVSINTMGKVMPSADPANKVFFGESVKSLRQLVKRYCRHEHIPLTNIAAATRNLFTSITRNSFPYPGGYCALPQTDGTVYLVDGSTNYYVFAYNTFLNYVASAYGGRRGSIRWIYDFSRALDPAVAELAYTVTRTSYGGAADVQFSILNSAVDVSGADGQATLMNTLKRNTLTMNGATIGAGTVNPVAAFEVPWYSERRFFPAKKLPSNPSFFDGEEMGHNVTVETNTPAIEVNAYIPTYCAAGEDFTCFMFLGLPPLYYEAPGTRPTNST